MITFNCILIVRFIKVFFWATTTRYEDYYSGLSASKYWIEFLQQKKNFRGKKSVKFVKMNSNWWIYTSLTEARRLNAKYLIENKEKFGVHQPSIEILSELCKKEAELLKKGAKEVPSRWESKSPKVWTQEKRNAQAKTIYEFLRLEHEINKILIELTGK